jgi:hypothetical protein
MGGGEERKQADVGADVNEDVAGTQEGAEERALIGLEVYTIDQAAQLAIQVKANANARLKAIHEGTGLARVCLPPGLPRALAEQLQTAGSAKKLN